MNLRFCILAAVLVMPLGAQEDPLRAGLEQTYNAWRNSVVTRNEMTWRKVTATHRQVMVKNRILSEKLPYPASIFELPGTPPSIGEMKYLGSRRSGPTAKSYYLGRVDFGNGPTQTENLLVLGFVGAAESWRYDQADFINLAALPEVRQELAAGDLRYIDASPELLPSGQVPPTPNEVAEAPYIAKVYAFCPGRQVRANVNGVSPHVFEDDQQAQIIIGGARPGANQLQFSISELDPMQPATGALTVRVYLMSQIEGVKPVKVYQYQVDAGQRYEPQITAQFIVDQKVHDALMGK
ncbi:MAG TPA: hypothetical protein VFY13_00580 [Luteolibacter sp.]|nr:hypothetical protein [Luteolibacter sp.]